MKNNTNDYIEGLKAGNVLTGFYLPAGSTKEYFFVTERKNKTTALASAVLTALQLPDAARLQSEILYFLQPARCSVKKARGKFYFDISGDNFGGYGSDDITDGKTVIITL